MPPKKRKVLVVDDDRAIRTLFNRILTHWGYAVGLAESGDDAIEQVKADNYDLVILDIVMPGRDGIETIRELNKITRVPKVLMSGRATMDQAIKAIRLGVADFLVKPFQVAEARLVIENVFKRYDLEAANQELEQRNRELTKLFSIGVDIGSQSDMTGTMNHVADHTIDLVGVEGATVYFLDRASSQVVSVIAQNRVIGHTLDEIRLDLNGDSHAAKVAREGAPLVVNKVARKPGPMKEIEKKYDYRTKSILAVPLIYRGQTIGVIEAVNKVDDKFDDSDLKILSILASFISPIIEKTTLSITDELTGLYNRRHLMRQLAKELDLQDRYGSPNTSLFMVDLDQFKDYNDTHGHPSGDVILKQLAKLLRQGVRKVDTVARYGGEEFVIILPYTSKVDAVRLGERIRQKVEKHPFPHRETQPGGRITISMGVATRPEDASGADELLKKADEALYQAKDQGRNRICLAGL